MKTMKYLILGTALLLAAAAFAQLTSSRAELAVKMSGFKSDRGVARVYLFRYEPGWPWDAPLAFATVAVPIAKREATAVIGDLPYGVYAVAAFHDENDDGVLNVNFFKVRTEGWAFARNRQALTEAPAFEDARVEVFAANVTVEVALQY